MWLGAWLFGVAIKMLLLSLLNTLSVLYPHLRDRKNRSWLNKGLLLLLLS